MDRPPVTVAGGERIGESIGGVGSRVSLEGSTERRNSLIGIAFECPQTFLDLVGAEFRSLAEQIVADDALSEAIRSEIAFYLDELPALKEAAAGVWTRTKRIGTLRASWRLLFSHEWQRQASPRQRWVRVQRIPMCPVHDCQLRIGSTQGQIRYFYCPVDGCKQSARVAGPLFKPVSDLGG